MNGTDSSSADIKEEKEKNAYSSEAKSKRAKEIALAKAKSKKRGRGLTALIIIIVIVIAYIIVALFFQNRFFVRTTINGTACSGKTVAETEKLLEKSVEDYTLTIKERDGTEEQVVGSDIGVAIDFGDELTRLLDRQNILTWPRYLIQEQTLQAELPVTYDNEVLQQIMATLPCKDEGRMTDSQNATLSEYTEGVGYEIVPEVIGTRLDEGAFQTAVAEKIRTLTGELDLDEGGCYMQPKYTKDSEEAYAMLDAANRCVNTTVTYHFGGASEEVNAPLISQWLVVGEDMGVTLDAGQVGEYVAGLAQTYNTAGRDKALITSYGSEVTVPGADYGWRINQDETSAALEGYILSGEDYDGEVVYSQTAASHDAPDYGNTYVEIDLSAQHLWFYKDGVLIVESPVVSGNVSQGNGTPAGAYFVNYKERNATLKGEDYETPVSYWMPFNLGIGLHDATWRGSFGGSIYRSSGSHGCVNLPYSVAQTIFENIEAGDAVLLYN